jgi:shikimate dehydrogenase
MNTPDFLPRLTGCFAMPAAENPTMAMVEAAYRHHHLHWRYINCEVPPEGLGDAVRGAKAMGWVGFNCSLPHKVAVIPYLDGLGESARVIGAVNTVVRRDDLWIGENTDGKGFVEAISEITKPAGKKLVIFGAGGAARAVAVEMALAGALEVIIVNRSRERRDILVDLLGSRTPVMATGHNWENTYQIPADTDIVIDTTSIGLYPNVHERLDIDFNTLRRGMVVADAIPNPPRTHLLGEAAARGCVTLDGLQMLVNQGVIAIKYWSGVDVDKRVMRDELNKVLVSQA